MGFLRTLFSPVAVTDTRARGFLAWTGFILITMCVLLGGLVWMAFIPEARAQIATQDDRFRGIFCLIGALVLAGQLIWTIAKGFVYCGTFVVVTKADDVAIYRVYCVIHLVVITALAIFAFLTLR